MKRLMTAFVSVFILASFLVSGINLSVHAHICKKDGVSYSLFSSVDHSCEKESETLSCEISTCCSSKGFNADYIFESEECCIDSFFVIESDSDINTLNQEVKADVQPYILSNLIDQDLFFVEKVSTKRNKAPPFLDRKTYLAKIQTYII